MGTTSVFTPFDLSKGSRWIPLWEDLTREWSANLIGVKSGFTDVTAERKGVIETEHPDQDLGPLKVVVQFDITPVPRHGQPLFQVRIQSSRIVSPQRVDRTRISHWWLWFGLLVQ